MNDTPSVSRSSAPVESSGTSITSVTDGPRSVPPQQEHEHPRGADRVGDELTDEAGDEHDAEREDDVLRRTRGRFSAMHRRVKDALAVTADRSGIRCPGADLPPAGLRPVAPRLTLAAAMCLTVIELLESPALPLVVLVAVLRLHDPLRRLPLPACLRVSTSAGTPEPGNGRPPAERRQARICVTASGAAR